MEVLQNYPVFVARQPIFTREDQVQGYELLFRDGQMKKAANVVDPVQATLDVICYGFDPAVSAMSRPKPVYINFPQELLIQRSALALPPKQCVVEILETVRPDSEVIEACQELKDNGYRLAVRRPFRLGLAGKGRKGQFNPLMDETKTMGEGIASLGEYLR